MPNTQNSDAITAIILAGGAGSRMGGRDKAWVRFRGKPLIESVIDRIRPQVAHILISCNRNTERFESLGHPVCCDPVRRDPITTGEPAFSGPLWGLASCISLVNTPYILVVPCDMPLLPTDLVSRLSESLTGHSVVCVHDGDRRQHLVFLAKTHLLSSLPEYLERGQKSVSGWLDEQNLYPADFADCRDTMLNINYVEQLSD